MYSINFIKCRKVQTPKTRPQDAGYDFYLPDEYGDMIIQPGESICVPSGIKVDVPDGYALIAFNKSGVAKNQKLNVGACVVDSNYIGEVHLHLFNWSNEASQIKRGQKLTQFILIPNIKPKLIEVNKFNKYTDRGDGAFGSTGLN